jgi:hypothetical protein
MAAVIPTAILSGPWLRHSPGFRYQAVTCCDRIWFWDSGSAERHGDEWMVVDAGDRGEAVEFVASTRPTAPRGYRAG